MASIYPERGKYSVSYAKPGGGRGVKRAFASRALANHFAAKVEERRDLAKAGILNPEDEQYAAHADVPLPKHVDAYAAYLKSKGRTAPYIAQAKSVILRVMEGAGIDRIDRMDAYRIRQTVADLPAKPPAAGELSARSKNNAVKQCQQFANWLVERSGRLKFHRLHRVDRWNEQVDQKRVRIIVPDEDILRLIETTRRERPRSKMSGPDRAMRYALAVATGFRQGTLFALTPESFHLAAVQPFIRMEAIQHKGRKVIDHPVSREVADMLDDWLVGKPARRPVFFKTRWTKTMVAFRHDLKAAGITYHEAGTNQFFDQHSFRNTFITAVIRAAGLKVAQDLAHHSTPVLTSRYARLGVDDYAKGLAGVPRVTRDKDGKAKGTAG